MSRSRPSGGSGRTRPSSGTSGASGKASMSTRPASSRPEAVRRPVQGSRARPGSSRRVDQTLPPFSARRYVVIWLGFMVVMLAVILALILFNSRGSSSSATGSSCIPADAGPGKYMVIQTDKGCIAARLRTEPDAKVTNTIANFEKKANAGEFNGRIFHRVENWVIQGGDPQGTGMGGGDMPSEYNQLPFKTGALGVARGQDPAINNDSQFFIVKSDADSLNGQYTNFGQVVAGMDVVNKIAKDDKMTKVSVETR